MFLKGSALDFCKHCGEWTSGPPFICEACYMDTEKESAKKLKPVKTKFKGNKNYER